MGKRDVLRLLTGPLLAAVMLSGTAYGVQPREAAPFFSAVKSFSDNGDAFEAEFRNGMRVVVEETFNTPLAVINALISIDPGRISNDHALRAAEACRRSVEPDFLVIGGIVSSSVGRGHLLIKAVIPSEETGRAIEILSKLGPVVPFEDSPVSAADPSAPAELLPHHTQARAVDLTLESLPYGAELGLEVPEKSPGKSWGGVVSGLVIAGAVRHEIVLNSIAEYFPADRTVPPLAQPKREADAGPGRDRAGIDYASFLSRLEFPVFTITCPVPPVDHPQRIQAEVLREIIGGGLASMLRTEEGEYALNFQHRAEIIDREADSFLIITVAVHQDYLDRVEMHVLAALSLLGTTELPGSLVTRAKSLYLIKLLQQLDSLPSRADAWSSGLARGIVKRRSSEISILKAIDPASLQAVGVSWLGLDRMFIREFIPAGSSRNFNSETFGETVDVLLPQSLKAAEDRLEKLTFNEPEMSFSLPELSSSEIPPVLRKSSVLRGPDIHIYELHNAPLVRIGIFYAGGFPDEGAADAGLTEVLVSSMLQSWSTDGFDPGMIGLEGRGCALQGVVNPDYFGFRATVLSSSFEPVVALLMRMITRFPVEDEMYSRYRNIRKYSRFLRNPADPAEVPGDVIPAGSGLARPADEASSSEQKRPSNLSSWYEKISASHPEIVIYGDVKGTSFMRGLVSIMSDSRLRKFSKPDRRNRSITRIKPVLVRNGDDHACTFFSSGLPANSGMEESLHLISRSRDGTETDIEWIILARRGYGRISVKGQNNGSEESCDPEKILQELRERKFSQREFNQAKVRAITNHYLATENPNRMLNFIIVRILSGEQGDFIRQLLVDLKQVRIVEVESVLETLFGE